MGASSPATSVQEILRKVGKAIALRRGDLLEVMAAEAGKTLEQGDTEVSEAIDFRILLRNAG